MNIYTLGLAAVAALIIGVFGFTGGPADTGPLKIGFMAPLSGDAAAYGEPVRNAMTLAVEEINAAGGIDGRQVEVIYEDSKCDGKSAATAAQKLVSVDKVRYIVGPVCSGEAFSALPVTSEAKVLMLSPGSSAPKLAGMSPYFMRTYPNDNITGVALAQELAKSYKTTAIITESTDYGLGIKGVYVAEAEKLGMRVVAQEDFTTGTSDFRTVLTRVKETNPQIIFINPQTSANLVRIARQAREIGITAPFATVVFNDPETVSSGSAVEGVLLVGTPGLSSESFKSVYTARFGSSAYEFFAGATYDNVYLIKQAIEAVGDDTEKVQNYLHNLERYDGTLGSYRFDQSGDIVGLPSVVQQIVNGALVTR